MGPHRLFRTIDLTLIGMFVALMGIGANITAWAPFLQVGGVPITLQTFFCFLSGVLLGSRRGAIAMIVYVFVGLAGVPVFAGFKGGLGTLLSPTFGFILSFIFTAYIIGKVIEYKKRPTCKTFIIASLVGLVFNYIIGTNYMYLALTFFVNASESFTYTGTWLVMLAYLPIDLVTIVAAAYIAPRIFHVFHKMAGMQIPKNVD
ncbi:biotin transporter BioY [Virgibacillus sp. SK37]|uniref:biotin transporter BioY n=1 Tax=Virgibacillus sp. SK37 TaxID=403957 RepID=UPI0004D0F03D|nr:biotin biosynthesis protein BioC [Virgibacillus sp. SK37]